LGRQSLAPTNALSDYFYVTKPAGRPEPWCRQSCAELHRH